MKILVFNAGSSSLKYRVIELPGRQELVGGEAQRVGPPTTEPARIVHRVNDKEETHYVEMADHAVAFDQVMRLLRRDSTLMPDALGHRVVHGGPRFQQHCRINDSVLREIEAMQDLAPLHLPPAVRLIQTCRRCYPDLPQVAVFDTAYHSTIPDSARTYALPRSLAEELGLQKYGFHGISHQYVASEAARMLGRPITELNAVSCHLGSGGASLCAIVSGKSVDNTMGYSPLQGLVMSTRCGDLDPAITMDLLAFNYGDHRAVERILNKRSGVLGLSKVSADIRDALQHPSTDGPSTVEADITPHIYVWRIRKYLGAYLTIVGAAHAVIFTDTIGETVSQVRQAVCENMEAFGLVIDPVRNGNALELPADVAAHQSPVRILVIPTNEELAIAQFTHDALTNDGRRVEAGGLR